MKNLIYLNNMYKTHVIKVSVMKEFKTAQFIKTYIQSHGYYFQKLKMLFFLHWL